MSPTVAEAVASNRSILVCAACQRVGEETQALRGTPQSSQRPLGGRCLGKASGVALGLFTPTQMKRRVKRCSVSRPATKPPARSGQPLRRPSSSFLANMFQRQRLEPYTRHTEAPLQLQPQRCEPILGYCFPSYLKGRGGGGEQWGKPKQSLELHLGLPRGCHRPRGMGLPPRWALPGS